MDESPGAIFSSPTMTTSTQFKCVAEVVVDYLAEHGVDHIFIVPGKQIDSLVSALIKHPTVLPIVANHELAAGYMADGYARARGGIAATFSIGGPGSANLVGAAVAANADRSPVLFITGNISASSRGTGKFQDAWPEGSNDAGIFRATLGVSLSCERSSDLATTLADAARQLAMQRPAHITIAEDMQSSAATVEHMASTVDRHSVASPNQAMSLPDSDWLAGGRVLLVADKKSLEIAPTIAAAAQTLALPVATDIHARGIVPEKGLHAAGHLGFVSHPRADALLDNRNPLRADRVVAIECNDHLLHTLKGMHGNVEVISAQSFAAWWMTHSTLPEIQESALRKDWLNQLALVHRPNTQLSPNGQCLSYAEVVDALASHLPQETIYVVDAGQVRPIAVARLQCQHHSTLLVADGMAPMGWSLGATIGAQLARPDSPVVALVGDGSMRMHGIEVATAVRYRLPILYVLFDNDAYGSVLARMDNQEDPDTARLPHVNWLAFAQAFGIEAYCAATPEQLRIALTNLRDVQAPRLLVARVPAINTGAGAAI